MKQTKLGLELMYPLYDAKNFFNHTSDVNHTDFTVDVEHA